MGKQLKINCAFCDARNVSEETLAAYEKITVNSASVLVTPRSQALLAKYRVALNTAGVTVVPEDVEAQIVNGEGTIRRDGPIPKAKRFLLVNGALEIEAGTEEILEQYVGGTVNGSIRCPESMASCLGRFQINGSTTCYPDGAIVLKRSAVIDRTFVLRAKEALYWSAKRMIFVDPKLDPAALAVKGARFQSEEAILAEGMAEALLPLIDERAELVLVPDGTKVALDDLDLDEVTEKRYGTRLYILGDAVVKPEGEAFLRNAVYLHIRGDVQVPPELRDLLLEKAEIDGDVKLLHPKKDRGRVIEDMTKVRLTQWLLENSPNGLRIEDCAEVVIEPDVDKKLILERLRIEDCAAIRCAPEQEDAVAAVCEDVPQIGQQSLQSQPEGSETDCINAASYVM